MAAVTDLLQRPVYGMSQVDYLLGLKGGTARRWIDGYERGGKHYPPVVRLEPTGEEIVTWGEFVETRLLSEFRDQGVPLIRMRPAVERLRERFHPLYPLAHARPYVETWGRELVYEIQIEVGLEKKLQLVVVRDDQLVLGRQAENFAESATFGQANGHGDIVESLRPVTSIREVVIDPLRQFGEPVVIDRSVRTEVIAEAYRAGEAVEGIAELFELAPSDVQAALRYELYRLNGVHEPAA